MVRSITNLALLTGALAGVACSSSSVQEGPGGSPGGTGGASDAGVATHSGLLSIQDMTIHGAPQAGHGLTVQIAFAPASAPDYEELPGQLTGCKAWVYEPATDPAPVPGDQGAVTISGLSGGSIECRVVHKRDC